jgi:uncharacterized oligopeptide transporter (OPT) family protein
MQRQTMLCFGETLLWEVRHCASMGAGASLTDGPVLGAAGDMMQDFKTAHLLGVCPRAQFFAMLAGSGFSVVASVAAFQLYTTAWTIPGPEFPAPTAGIWIDMAELVR